ncbi:hypothetical protein LTR84_006163 [Exophiala bonariae]|uniref:HNH nuclease domain-containing protein n=1 Tax=Exophiala bonariae TaxID=1690606 RepID=A0AAV9N205_9EURO|nr:hypothetical protein LTR84_006163 [Exophiala bonariae]
MLHSFHALKAFQAEYTPLIFEVQNPSPNSKKPHYLDLNMPLMIPSKHTVVLFPSGIKGPALFKAHYQPQEEEPDADEVANAIKCRRRMLKHVVWMLAEKDVYSVSNGLLLEQQAKIVAHSWKRVLLKFAKNDVTAAVSLAPLNFAILIHMFLLEFDFIKFRDVPGSEQDVETQDTETQSTTPTTQSSQTVRSRRPRNRPLYHSSTKFPH